MTLNDIIDSLRAKQSQLRDKGQAIAGKKDDRYFIHTVGNMAHQMVLGNNGYTFRIVTEHNPADVITYRRSDVSKAIAKIQQQYPTLQLTTASLSAFCLWQVWAIDAAIDIIKGGRK